jgi:hypothetical protein
MALEELEQQGRGLAVSVLTLAAIGLYLDATWLLDPVGANPDDIRIRQSAWIVVFVWPIAAACLQLHHWNPARYVESRHWVRAVHTVGLLGMLLHLAVAYHLGHGWSHADAFDRTERVSGFGPGIFVSDFFVLVWAAEAVWMWMAFGSYLNRPRWLNRAVVGFMWFILFNSTVVYGSGFARLLGVAMLTLPWLAARIMKGNDDQHLSRGSAGRSQLLDSPAVRRE